MPLIASKLKAKNARGLMPKYEYRFKSSTDDMKLGSILNVESDALAKAHGDTAFATFLDFDSLELWLLDRRIETWWRGA